MTKHEMLLQYAKVVILAVIAFELAVMVWRH
jgi:hypothetical protein